MVTLALAWSSHTLIRAHANYCAGITNTGMVIGSASYGVCKWHSSIVQRLKTKVYLLPPGTTNINGATTLIIVRFQTPRVS